MPNRLSGLYGRVRDFSFLTFLIALTGLALALASWDIFWKSFEKDNRSVFTFGAALVMLVVSTFLVVLSRLISARSAMADVPKVYVPINRNDLTKQTFKLINDDLNFAAAVRSKIHPLPEDQLETGWGRKGTAFEGVHFATAAASTIVTLENHLVQQSLELKREEGVPVRDYVESLVAENILDSDLALYYLELYEKARFGGTEVTEREYVEMLKVVVLLCQGSRVD